MKQAILLLTNRSDYYVVNSIEKILSARNEHTDVYVLYHQNGSEIPDNLKPYEEKIYPFTSDLLYSMGYMPLGDSIAYGNTHFPLLDFFLHNPSYDYYWLIEDDVCFTGKWSTLFESYLSDDSDLISTYIRTFDDEPNWAWWRTLHTHDDQIERCNIVAAFNPIFRISRRGLSCLNEFLLKGWRGHLEVIVSSVLNYMGMSLKDMGVNNVYHGSEETALFYSCETHRYQNHRITQWMPNQIYHPVKRKIGNRVLKKYCVISAVGKGSLHQNWIKGKENEERNFDLHLIVYDSSYGKYYNDADFLSNSKGYKLRLVYDYLNSHPEFLERYEYFFLPDDDILSDACQIEDIFHAMEKYKLEIAQPALKQSFFSYPQTLRMPGCKLRYTDFVEMMAPCFSRRALKKVLQTFNANTQGWGTETHWPILIDTNGRDMGIIDEVPVVHTRQLQSPSEQNFKEMQQYLAKNNLKPSFREIGCILSDDSFNSDPEFLRKHNRIYRLLDNTRVLSRVLCSNIKVGRISRRGLNGILNVAVYLKILSNISEMCEFERISYELYKNADFPICDELSEENFINGQWGKIWASRLFKNENKIKMERKKTDMCYNPKNLIKTIWPNLASKISTEIMFRITEDISNKERSEDNYILKAAWKDLFELHSLLNELTSSDVCI